MTLNDILIAASTLFFVSILIASVVMLWNELTRDIEPYSEGD